MPQSRTIVFIHGLFQNPNSWKRWAEYFQSKGYTCHVPAYPYHDGDPNALRQNSDPRLGSVTLKEVVVHLSAFIDTLPEKPILIGHSMGGLVVQKLIASGRGSAGICIDTAPPKGIFSLEWSFLKANFPTINPLQGNSVCLPSVEWFHYAFCNTMSMEETKKEYQLFVVPESRNIPRSSTLSDGAINFKAPHNPMLFIAGEKDNIIPWSLNKKNYAAYKDSGSKRDFKVFPGRTHYICGQQGWEEVADYCHSWITSIK